MDDRCFQSRLFLPAWWVQAYDASAVYHCESYTPFDIAKHALLTPALTPLELNSVAVLFPWIQKQILSQQSCVLNPSEHRKFNSVGGLKQTFAFERVLQLLCSIKFLRPSSGGMKCVELLKETRWDPTKEGGLAVSLEFTEAGKTAFLGFNEPYVQMTTGGLPQEAESSGLQANEGPLALNQSVWLDLQGIEQALYLRIEKAMQWDDALVRLDGSFERGYTSLFKGLDHKLGRNKGLTPFQLKLRTLQRLGRKLVEHGVLQGAGHEHDFAAFDQDGHSRLNLVWKGNLGQIYGHDREQYEKIVSQFLVSKYYVPRFERVLATLSGGNVDDRLRRQVGLICDFFKNQGIEAASQVLVRDEGNLLMAGPLFIEWLVRQVAGHKLALPEVVAHSDLARMAATAQGQPPLELFERFTKTVREDVGLLELLQTEPLVTVASKASRASSSFRSWIKPSSGKFSSSPGQKVQKPLLPKVDQQRDKRKMALLELQRLRDQEPSRYLELKRQYKGTLDDSSVKIIEEVERRLKPKVFEDHIKNSLIKFMLENPQSW